jgi:hypothetical protein
MFIGHFAAALAAKRIDNKPSLGTMFLAAQWLDLLWPVLLLTGTEKVAIDPGNSATTPLNFIHYPISHSLMFVLLWSLLFTAIHYIIRRDVKSALIIGGLVLSHWVLDFIVHIPDLPITPFTGVKVGLGLWNYKYLSLAIEMLFFSWAVYIYSKTTTAINKTGKIAFWSLIIFLFVIHIMNVFGPPPPDVKPVAVLGLAQWLLVAWAYWADRNRKPLSTKN